jgi:hypothetical protein
VLVEPAAREDLRPPEPRVIEQPPRFPREPIQVSGVETDADLSPRAQLFDHLDRVPHAGQRVVGVDEERRAVGMILRERTEGLAFVIERGDERVGHRAGDRQPELARRLDVGRGPEADDRASARRSSRSLDTVGAAEREVDQPTPFRSDQVARRLRGERRVQCHLVQQNGFHELRFGDRRRHLQDRLSRVHDAAFRNGPDLAGETHVREIVDRPLVEPDAPEGREVVLLEGERLEEPQAVLQAGSDQEPSLLRHVSHVQAERRRAIHPAAQIARRHVELVEVRAQPAGHAT